MPNSGRLVSERTFHDRQAQLRSATFAPNAETYAFTDDDYLDHETWIRPAFERLGDVAGKSALDFGCGHGMAAVVLARRGAEVTAFDLSAGYLSEARQRAEANGTSVRFVQADGERLPFANESFDRIWGNAILHHLDLDVAGRELYRVLRPGGIAVFSEPWGENPVLSWARKRISYGAKDRTPDERPLCQPQLDKLREFFPSLEVRGFQLFSMIRRVVTVRPLIAALERADRLVLSRVPSLGHFCRYVVLTLRRGSYNHDNL
jgi:ubiquinone/menaquinone biosynthesis C-methylase UbiE